MSNPTRKPVANKSLQEEENKGLYDVRSDERQLFFVTQNDRRQMMERRLQE
jgi:hypothetical protein